MTGVLERKNTVSRRPEARHLRQIANVYSLAERMVFGGYGVNNIVRKYTEATSEYTSSEKTKVIGKKTNPVKIMIDGNLKSAVLEGEIGERPNGDPAKSIKIVLSEEDQNSRKSLLYDLNPFSAYSFREGELKTPDQFRKLEEILKSIEKSLKSKA